MKGSAIRGAAIPIAFVGLILAACQRDLARDVETSGTTSAGIPASDAGTHEGLLYARVTIDDGSVYEGRLRWGGDEEALWGNYFNGYKDENPWASYVPSEQLRGERPFIDIFGFRISGWGGKTDLGRPFMARMGDIARIEPTGREIRVVLKSGSEYVLDRFSADDLADGVRIWDRKHGVVDIGEWQIRSVELLEPAQSGTGPAASGSAPLPLYGTVRTRQGEFTGFVQWDREECLDTDQLDGRTADGDVSLPFNMIGSIARQSQNSALVTLVDGGEIVLSGTRNVGEGNRGLYVDDPRYGRVLISWDAFEQVDFSPGGTGPAYGDFQPGRPLTGTVFTRSGRRLAGRLVYDLDESETTETLDAPSQGVDYTIPFGLIASIVLPVDEERGAQHARVILNSGEELQLELGGDLAGRNAGMLVFLDSGERPEFVPWSDLEQVDFEHPPEM